MRQIELLQHLIGSGYPPRVFSVLGVGLACNEGMVLEALRDDAWRIAVYERGAFSYEVALFESEQEACRQYLERIKTERVVLVMWPSLLKVEALRSELEQKGVAGRVKSLPASIFGVEMHQLSVSASHYEAALSAVLIELK